MSTTLTVRLSKKDAKTLQTVSKLTGKSRSEIVREALRSYTFRERLKAVRAVAVPRARKIGWLTDEDVFQDVS